MKTSNFLMVSNYEADLSWIREYTNDYIIYDRSKSDFWVRSFPVDRVYRVENVGWDIYDKMTWIIDNYDNLPPVTILTKGNIFKYTTKAEFDEICDTKFFAPIMTRHHKVYAPVCFYDQDGMYNEVNNSWYLNAYPARYFTSYTDFAQKLGLPAPEFLQFAPGSNYIVPRDHIRQWPKSFYEKLKGYVSYKVNPGEAQIIERSLYYIWQ